MSYFSELFAQKPKASESKVVSNFFFFLLPAAFQLVFMSNLSAICDSYVSTLLFPFESSLHLADWSR